SFPNLFRRLSNCSFADYIKLVEKEVSKVDEIEMGETETTLAKELRIIGLKFLPSGLGFL
ncbi:11985_t:CDS:2, partial [Racocetra fulgida]